jgi:F-type H+-transporting ATPase subunit epsilon
MASFHLDLVSPEKLLFSGEVNQVDVPGSEGDFGVLAGHAPLISTLRPGILTIFREGGSIRVVVNGGFAEVSPAGLTVLADMAVPVEDFNPSVLAGEIKNTEESAAAAKDDARRDKLTHRIDQLKALQAELTH